ncbi:hypothetical protein CLMAG_23800 [Clostridium magnum DSM 2767]|uniref:Uncharacterized protein n=1 Tax=Clostridium magnum DSM 2767 TaxID=1121326 RepID=A0A161XDY9_9CLOT|nr:hypothetical protein CLMAG_23800 [Clostridium magnum DSM 2767]SHI81476.1 hypothetical protein SAMN02745944_04900 [Clostridium magnum DSM 2767]
MKKNKLPYYKMKILIHLIVGLLLDTFVYDSRKLADVFKYNNTSYQLIIIAIINIIH